METLTKTVWAIDPTHSEIGFKIKHMMISTVKGYFETFNATVETEGDGFENADIDVTVDINSINTRNSDRDAHLKSDDFFNAEQFPEMKFKSKTFDGKTLVGDLTIRDITNEVTLNVEHNGTAVDPYGQTKSGFEITGEISRSAFGLKWNAVTEAGNIVVADKVNLMIDAQFVKQEN